MQEIRRGENKTKATHKRDKSVSSTSSSHMGLNYSHFQPGGLTCAVQSEAGAEDGTESGTEAGTAETHICRDKNRSIPRKVIRRRREIVRRVGGCAEQSETATGPAASLLPLSFPTFQRIILHYSPFIITRRYHMY